MDTDKQKFFIYARKSTDDLSRQVRSIDDQIAELRELARRDGLNVVDILIEKQTAKMPGRPVFSTMLDRIEKGEASGILAWHPDRLARNSVDGGRIIWLVDTKDIEALKFCTYRFDPTPQGKLNLAIEFGISKYYVDKLSDDICRGQRQKLKNGIWPKMAPVGYVNDRKARVIVADQERGPLVRKAFELYASGNYTIDRITESVNGLGMIGREGEPLSRAQYHRMLQNPIYCGAMRYKGELHEGKHEPLVTKKLFDKAQDVMQRKSKPKAPRLKSYMYRGIFRCGECGCFVTTETQKGANYLRCTKRVKKDCSQRYVREETIAEQVASYLRAIALPGDAAELVITELERERDGDSRSRQDAMQGIREKMSELEAKLNRLMDAYLEHTVSLEEYGKVKTKLVMEKQELKDKLKTLEENRGDWFEPAIRFVKAAKSTAFVGENGTEEEKRDFLKNIGSNLTISNRHLSVEPRDAWKTVVNYGRLAQHTAALEVSAAVFAGESSTIETMRRR